MPEDILVVEYEPRYTDRVKQALSGQPFTPHFARDGEEALRVLEGGDPRLIVLSSVIPKISTNELIKRIRGQSNHRTTPILLTVSGYSGKSTTADAGKLGANDILPKPYSETEFLGKVRQLLGGEGGSWAGELGGDFKATPVSAPAAAPAGAQLTSDQIFGDLLDDERAAKKPSQRVADDDLDKILNETLSGIRAPKKKDDVRPAASPAATQKIAPVQPPPRPVAPATEAKSKTTSDLDKLLNETLSGLSSRPKTAEAPKPEAAAEARPRPVEVPKTVVAPQPAKAPVVPPPAPAAAAPVARAPEPQEEVDESDGTRFGQYVLLERIASGGMAEVWKARMRGVEGFQKIVAIKKILPHLSDNSEFTEMFVDEAKLAAQLNHNNIIHIYDLGKVANSYFIAMEYIDGHDLKSILRQGAERGQPMPIELALLIASKLAAALDYAHRKRDFEEREMGLVHRDVSPQNVLISYEGDIKLCDFGIAKAASKASHTQAGALKGKLQYMSPEQAWGRKIDRRSDIFALAAVLFEMITGRKLFTGESELTILEQVREARVTPPSEINDEATPEVDAIVMKALQKDPEARYQTAGEMARDLDQVLYSFRPTPTSADLAIYMHRIYSDEPVAVAEPMTAPRIEEEKSSNLLAVPEVIEIPAISAPLDEVPATTVVTPLPAAFTAPAAVDRQVTEEARMFGAPAEEPKKKLPIIPIVAAVVVLAALGGWFVLRKGSDPAAAAPATQTTQTTGQTATSAPATTTLPPAQTVSTSVDAVAVTPTGTVTGTVSANDQAVIDQEVQKRLAAERLRLEQQRAAQLAAQQAPAASQPTSTPAPAPAQPQPAAAQPSAPASQPTATVAESRPEPPAATPVAAEPPPAAPVRPTTREGDLVDANAPGLTPPELIRMKEPTYPPVARSRRIQGEVMLNVLVSETGRVLDVRVIRSLNPDLGFSAAAIDAVRSATFRPATKDGVRVRTYKTLKVTFKL